MCKKEKDCWQPADLSKSVGNCQKKAKIPSLRLMHIIGIILAHWNAWKMENNICLLIYRIKGLVNC